MHQPVTGVIAIDKPAGVSSRRVVDAVAAALGTKSVGHAGTLDPLATGVVVVCAGHATKLVDFVHDLPKHYRGTFLLGRSSASDDLETEVVAETAPVRPSPADLDAALPAFRGAILQRPCDYSAVHVDGKRAYRLARKGRPVEIAAKPVRIDRLEVTGYDWPRLDLDIICSSGTFVRAIGRDLGAALGTRAVMESLVRTAVGPFTQATAWPLAAVSPETVRGALLPAAAAVPHLPRLVLDDAALAVRGQSPPGCPSTWPTGGNAEGDRGRHSSQPARADVFHSLLAHAVSGGFVDLGADAAEAIAAIDAAGDLVGILRRHESGRHRLRPNFRGAGANQ